jgi:putative drug exporter of the RND superfamily
MAGSADKVRRMVTGRWSAWVVLVVAVLTSGAVLALGGAARVSDDPTAGLPAGTQSTQVARLQQQLPSAQTSPALVVYSRNTVALSAADVQAITAQRVRLAPSADGGEVSPLQLSPDRTVALIAVALPAGADDATNTRVITAVRAAAATGLPAGVVAQVTGGPAFQADIADAFSGTNVMLLLVTAGVVALLLLITYRSPILWLVPLTVVAVADQVSNALISMLSRHTDLAFDEAVTGIVEVLVFGAGTDYALLLIARYREELRENPDRREAMRQALRTTGPVIAASATTVVLALLTLLFAVLGGDKAIGVAGAIGIATALLFALVVLPAALVVCPRGVFWPLVPRADEAGRRANAEEGRVWRRIGNATGRRPWPIIATSVVLLAGLSFGVLSTTLGLSQADTFRIRAESVDGLTTLARGFPAGTSDPTAVITNSTQQNAVLAAVRAVDGVADARSGNTNGTITQLDVILDAAPDTPASYATIRALRTAVAGVPGADAVVGGTVATDLDTRTAALRDLRVIAPLILVVVFLVLIVLLRALVAPVVLIATVILSFGAALGAASLVFSYALDYPGLDNQVPLLAFLFLVALGVDYNIFLITRAKEDAAANGTRAGIVNALAVTGGVITSAGILLAAVFTVLGVLPVTVLTEIGIIVGLGVLIDTLLVRTVLVPAAVHVLGDRFWAPGRLKGNLATSGHTAMNHAVPAES